MRLSKLNNLVHRRRGFTLIEILIGVVITGLLVGGITVAIAQTINVNAASNSRMTAIKQVENAIDSLRPDIIMARGIGIALPSGFPLQLSQVQWDDGAETLVTYSVNANSELVRQESVGGNTTSRVIARNIASISMRDPAAYTGGKITLTIAATVPGFKSATETRTFDILPRAAK